MKTQISDADAAGEVDADSRNALAAAAFSPLVWGTLLTVGFYYVLPYLPIEREAAQRYFAGHWIEYVETGLFIIGMTILAQKGLRLAAERAALSGGWLDDAGVPSGSDTAARVDAFQRKLRALPVQLRRTQLAERVRDVCSYIAGRKSAEGLDEHLKYRADLALGRLHDGYATVRTITWAIPILGFLGTVIGITIAIANLQPEQLATSLNEVTAGLAVAFDTTALALGLSLVLVFSSFLVEGAEQGILARVEEFGLKRLGTSFAPPPAAVQAPLAAAQSRAAEQILVQTESLLLAQAELWRQSLDALRERWSDLLSEQTVQFRAALQDGMQGTLADHADQLAAIRGEFLEAFRGTARELSEGLAEARAGQRELQTELAERLDETCSRVEAGFAALGDGQSSRVAALTQAMAQSAAAWDARLRESAEASRAQLAELHRHGELLGQIVGQEQELARLQARLTENLEAVRAAETFEETLHSLNAAVHLLAGRTRPKAA